MAYIYNEKTGEFVNFSESSPKHQSKPVDENDGMGFGETLGYFFNHYADFSGRARRREYWFMYLWGVIFGIIPYVNIIMALVFFIPSLALFVRRMHDVGRSGFVLFLSLIPIVGGIILFVWTVTDSDVGDNEYGSSPKYSKSKCQ